MSQTKTRAPLARMTASAMRVAVLASFVFVGHVQGAAAQGSPAPDANVRSNLQPVVPRGVSEEEVLPLSIPLGQIPNYRDFMRQTVIDLAHYANGIDPKFKIVVRNGFELFRRSLREKALDEIKDPAGTDQYRRAPVGIFHRPYMRAIDGVMVDGMYCGGDPNIPAEILAELTRRAIPVLGVDHCKDQKTADLAVAAAPDLGLGPSYADTDKMPLFNTIPKRRPVDENAQNIERITDAQNMLIFTDTTPFTYREDWVLALEDTNFDILVIDPFHKRYESLTFDETRSLRFKRVGARRMVLAVLNLTEADDRRFYWRPEWRVGNPPWIDNRNLEDPALHYITWWSAGWKEIIGQYFKGLMDLGVDGVVLEGLDGWRYWEWRTPIE